MNYTVVSVSGEPVAQCRFAEDAATLVAVYGAGARVVYGKGLLVWTEGDDGAAAGRQSAVACHMRDIIDAAVRK